MEKVALRAEVDCSISICAHCDRTWETGWDGVCVSKHALRGAGLPRLRPCKAAQCACKGATPVASQVRCCQLALLGTEMVGEAWIMVQLPLMGAVLLYCLR